MGSSSLKSSVSQKYLRRSVLRTPIDARNKPVTRPLHNHYTAVSRGNATVVILDAAGSYVCTATSKCRCTAARKPLHEIPSIHLHFAQRHLLYMSGTCVRPSVSRFQGRRRPRTSIFYDLASTNYKKSGTSTTYQQRYTRIRKNVHRRTQKHALKLTKKIHKVREKKNVSKQTGANITQNIKAPETGTNVRKRYVHFDI